MNVYEVSLTLAVVASHPQMINHRWPALQTPLRKKSLEFFTYLSLAPIPTSYCMHSPSSRTHSNVTAYEYSACMVSSLSFQSSREGGRGGSNLWVQYVHLVSVLQCKKNKKIKERKKQALCQKPTQQSYCVAVHSSPSIGRDYTHTHTYQSRNHSCTHTLPPSWSSTSQFFFSDKSASFC